MKEGSGRDKVTVRSNVCREELLGFEEVLEASSL
jgi:hypothetical protein